MKCLPYLECCDSIICLSGHLFSLLLDYLFTLSFSCFRRSEKKIVAKNHPLVLRTCQLSAEVLHQMFRKAAEMSSKRQALSKTCQAKPSTLQNTRAYILYPFYSNQNLSVDTAISCSKVPYL